MRESETEGDFFFSLCWADVLKLPVSVNFEDIDFFYTNLKLISLISCTYYSQKHGRARRLINFIFASNKLEWSENLYNIMHRDFLFQITRLVCVQKSRKIFEMDNILVSSNHAGNMLTSTPGLVFFINCQWSLQRFMNSNSWTQLLYPKKGKKVE